MNKNLLFVLVFCISILGVGQAFAQCLNVNINIEGTINADPACPIDEVKCLVGNTQTNPPYQVKIILSDRPIQHSSLHNVTFLEGSTTITAQNGSELVSIGSLISRGGDSVRSERLVDVLTLTGGTGIFNDSAGEFLIDSQLDNANSTFTSNMSGEICFNVN